MNHDQIDLQITLYSYRFITETLFPKGRIKAIDVQPGGVYYALTQVLFNRLCPTNNVPVDVLFNARSDQSSFSQYGVATKLQPLLTQKVVNAFSQLTSKLEEPRMVAKIIDSFFAELSVYSQHTSGNKQIIEINQKVSASFEAVESYLKENTEKLAIFETILSDWTKASPQFRARAINYDPFIDALCTEADKILNV